MPKRIRDFPVYLAPHILSFCNEEGKRIVKDESRNIELNPFAIDDKIKIYERQVIGWFLNRASSLTLQNNSGFIVLMICLSYLEGVQQYRLGQRSFNRSREYFCDSINRLYPSVHSRANLNELYTEARCSLFHNGMVEGKIIINDDYPEPIAFPDADTIKISPRKLLEDIKTDFNEYLLALRDLANTELRNNFNIMFSNF